MTVTALEVSAPKTKDFLTLISPITGTDSALIISNTFTENTYLAARNVSHVHLVRSADVNAEDLLRYKKVVITTAALDEIAKRINS
jgi:large subunit ribosomal protein L4